MIKIGDLVRLVGIWNAWIGLVIGMKEEQSIQTDYEPWFRITILFPYGYIGWEYDIDLEVISESR